MLYCIAEIFRTTGHLHGFRKAKAQIFITVQTVKPISKCEPQARVNNFFSGSFSVTLLFLSVAHLELKLDALKCNEDIACKKKFIFQITRCA